MCERKMTDILNKLIFLLNLYSFATTSTPCKPDKKSKVAKCYYVITESTKVQFETGPYNGSAPDKEIVSAKEILNNIGGLDEEIEMLVEATKTVLGPKPTRYAHTMGIEIQNT